MILQLVTSATCFGLVWPSSGLQRDHIGTATLCTLIDTNLCKPDDGQTMPKHVANETSFRITPVSCVVWRRFNSIEFVIYTQQDGNNPFQAVNCGNSLPTFRDTLLLPSSKVKNPSRSSSLTMGLKLCPETSLRSYHYWLRSNPEERGSCLLYY